MKHQLHPVLARNNSVKDAHVVKFLIEIDAVCRKAGLSIAHEDGQGAFMIMNYSRKLRDWFFKASVNVRNPIQPKKWDPTDAEMLDWVLSKEAFVRTESQFGLDNKVLYQLMAQDDVGDFVQLSGPNYFLTARDAVISAMKIEGAV